MLLVVVLDRPLTESVWPCWAKELWQRPTLRGLELVVFDPLPPSPCLTDHVPLHYGQEAARWHHQLTLLDSLRLALSSPTSSTNSRRRPTYRRVLVPRRRLPSLQVRPVPQAQPPLDGLVLLSQDVRRLPRRVWRADSERRCESCIDRIFSLGPEPCPSCGTTVRKAQFRPQVFENLGVQKEVAIRKRTSKM